MKNVSTLYVALLQTRQEDTGMPLAWIAEQIKEVLEPEEVTSLIKELNK